MASKRFGDEADLLGNNVSSTALALLHNLLITALFTQVEI
jgi:hypothetical protein